MNLYLLLFVVVIAAIILAVLIYLFYSRVAVYDGHLTLEGNFERTSRYFRANPGSAALEYSILSVKVTITAAVNAKTGLLAPADELQKHLRETLLTPYSHRIFMHESELLDLSNVPDLQRHSMLKPASLENITIWMFHQLYAVMKAKGYRVTSLTLRDAEFEYTYNRHFPSMYHFK